VHLDNVSTKIGGDRPKKIGATAFGIYAPNLRTPSTDRGETLSNDGKQVELLKLVQKLGVPLEKNVGKPKFKIWRKI